MIDIIFKIRNKVTGKKRIKLSNLPNKKNIEIINEILRIPSKRCKNVLFKNPILKRLITFATTGEQSSETLPILIAIVVFITTA